MFVCLFVSPDDHQGILIETSSCNLEFFSELITTQLREFHMVSPQVVFTLLIFLTMQSYKFYLVVCLFVCLFVLFYLKII